MVRTKSVPMRVAAKWTGNYRYNKKAKAYRRPTYVPRNRFSQVPFPVEMKYKTYEYDGAIVQTVAGAEADPATFLCLSAVAQGDGESDRDGKQIRVTGIYMRGQVLFAADSASSALPLGDYVRILIICDTQTNGAQFNAEDVLADTTDTDLDSLALRNLQYTQRFTILKDETIARPYIGFTGTVATPSYAAGGVMVPFKINIPFKTNIPVNFNTTTGVIGAVVDNSIHVIAIAGGRASNQLRYIARMRYIG